MTNLQMDLRLKTALFVDFDNIFIRLMEEDRNAAEIFATQPLKWVLWLEESLPLSGATQGQTIRKILVRHCYLNPKSFGGYRPYFTKSAFETVDCPALTTQGKTSADIHMVLDILELLDHSVDFDEFIIMSGDADFTPVLLKLRKWNKHTAVLAVGPSSPAYRAACDVLIDQDIFLEEALGNKDKPEIAAPFSPLTESSIEHDDLEKCSAFVREYVQKARDPVSMAEVAIRLQQRLPDLSANWLGHTSFKNFLFNLNLEGLKISYVNPGYVYNPEFHNPPEETLSVDVEADFSRRYPELSTLAKKICDLTDTPYLMPEHYTKLFEALLSEIQKNGYHFTSTSKAVRDKCKEMNLPVGRQHINFILRGIAFTGHRFGTDTDQPAILANRLFENTLNLCENAQVKLTEHEIRMINEWFMPSHAD